MKHKLENWWTGTIWTGNNTIKTFSLIHNILDEVSWMTSFAEVVEYCTTWDKRGKTLLFKRMKKYKETLVKEFWYNVDPIKYLIFLYFQEWKSYDAIFKSENEKWLNYKDTRWLSKMLTNTLWWISRDNWGSELTRKRKIASGQIEKASITINKEYDEKHEKVIKYIKDKVDKIFWPFPKFEYENFNKIRKHEKILYILSCINGINKEDIIKIKQNWIWTRIIAKELNKIIESFLIENEINDFEISARNISDIIKS